MRVVLKEEEEEEVPLLRKVPSPARPQNRNTYLWISWSSRNPHAPAGSLFFDTFRRQNPLLRTWSSMNYAFRHDGGSLTNGPSTQNVLNNVTDVLPGVRVRSAAERSRRTPFLRDVRYDTVACKQTAALVGQGQPEVPRVAHLLTRLSRLSILCSV